jgi:hypothetical protein
MAARSGGMRMKTMPGAETNLRRTSFPKPRSRVSKSRRSAIAGESTKSSSSPEWLPAEEHVLIIVSQVFNDQAGYAFVGDPAKRDHP